MGLLSLTFGFAALIATAGLLAASLRLPGATDFLLAGYLIAAAEMIAVALALSPFDALTRPALLIACGALLVVAVGVWVIRGRPAPPSLRPAACAARKAFRDPVLLVLGVAVVGALSYAAVVAVATPPNDFDSLWYHLARAAFWKQEHAVAYVESANDLRLNVFTPGAEVLSVWAMVLEGSERFAGLLQLVSLLATMLAIAGLSRRLGLDPRTALFGALLFATLPVVALQAATPLNDIAVAAFLAIAIYFLRSEARPALALGALALALAVGTKGTTLLALPLLMAVAAVLSPRRRWPAVLLAGAVGLVAGSFWYVVNAVETGAPIPRFVPISDTPEHTRSLLRIPAAVARMAVDTIDPAGSVGRDRFLYALAAGTIVVAGVLVGARRRSRNPLLVGAGAAALVLLPLAFDPLHDRLLRGYQKLWLELDQRDLAFLASDRDPTQPTPFTSWYGPLGLLLFLAALPLVVREIRRGALPRGSLVLLLSPVLFVVILAMSTTYGPFNGRYLMFPVALAAATWGVVISVRPLAWAASAIAAVTLVLSFVHYLEKPAGFSVLGGASPPSVWTQSRIDVLSSAETRGGAGPLRVIESQADHDATVALRIRQDDVSYPYFGAELDRRIVFVDGQGEGLVGREDWLVVAPGLRVKTCASGWLEVPAQEAGWRLYRRVDTCPGESAAS